MNFTFTTKSYFITSSENKPNIFADLSIGPADLEIYYHDETRRFDSDFDSLFLSLSVKERFLMGDSLNKDLGFNEEAEAKFIEYFE